MGVRIIAFITSHTKEQQKSECPCSDYQLNVCKCSLDGIVLSDISETVRNPLD